MDHFAYRNGVLYAEDVPVPLIAEQVGTPFYCYSSATFERHFKVFEDAFAGLDALICFAVKSNSNVAVLKTLGRLGSGADVVSLGELERALAAGIPAERIVFSGVGKTDAEIKAALEHRIYQFNVESEPELERVNEIALSMGLRAPVSLRINPDVDALTHEKISTGKGENKFGIAWDRAEASYALAGSLPGVDVVGLDVHIGSQITELKPFENAFLKVAQLVRDLRAKGHRIDRLDLGGGLGVPYHDGVGNPPHPIAYAEMIKEIADGLNVRLIFEPGRLIAGNAGILVSKVIFRKEGENRTFLIIDAAMNDLMRPALYSAYHQIIAVDEDIASGPVAPVDVVGPVCETTDTFAKERALPFLQSGNLLALKTAGAYGAVLSSTYNSRALVPEVMVRGDQFAVIRERPPLEELLRLDKVPDWLET